MGRQKGRDPAPSVVPPYVVGPTGRQPQRSSPVNPTYRPNQRPPQPMAPSASVQSFPPLNQPLPVGPIDASASGFVPAFPAGSLDWLKNFLQEILSPADYLKYKSSFDPTPQKEEVPLALQLANKTKERGSVLAQIERERVLVGDLKAKYEKHTETLTQLMERKYTLQREIEELEMLSAAAEEKQHNVPVETVAPVPPHTPQPVGPRETLPGPPPLMEEDPHEEEGDDEAMEPGDIIPGAGVGFVKPTKRRLSKATAVNRVLRKGVFSKGRRSQAGKVPPLSPMRSAAHSGHPVFYDTARQTAEKSNVFGVLGSNSSGTPLLAQCADSGAPLLRAPGSHFADDRLAARDELVSGERSS